MLLSMIDNYYDVTLQLYHIVIVNNDVTKELWLT